MPVALIHLLTSPGDLAASTVVCGARDAALATWDLQRVTCPQCTPATARRSHPPRLATIRSETAFQEEVRKAAVAGQWLYFHCHDARRSPEGFPDCVLVRLEPSGARARVVFAELKMPGKTPTDAQARWLARLGRAQAPEVYVWYPDDMDTILEVLR